MARSVGEIETLGSVWDSLMNPELSLFQSHRWNLLAAKFFGEREEPHFVFAENDNGAAILPAVIQTQSRTLSFAGESLLDYRDYLATGDHAPLMAAWQKLATLDLRLSITAISRMQAHIWERMPKTFFSIAPRLNSGQVTAEGFVQDHSRAFSRVRKLRRMGLHIIQHSGNASIVAEIYRLRTTQSTGTELFHDSLRAEFMVAVCRAEGSNCEIFSLEAGSTVVAALVTFRDADWRRCYTIFYDRGWARFSPGTSLLFEVVRRSLEQGISVDLMTGEQPYKMRMAESTQDLFKVSASVSEMHKLFPASVAADIAA